MSERPWSIACARLKRVGRFAPLVLATSLLAQRAISGILTKLGHPGASLDDAYIHFQYARAFAEGHPFRFQAGEPISTGATSFLWPILLAPFYALGFQGESILWPAWVISFVALGALAYEAHLLAKPLAGRAAAIGAGAMTLAFGGFAWCAASGMEVVPFAWLIATATRRASEWAEAGDARGSTGADGLADPSKSRSRRSFGILLALAFACPLMRPEGAITSVALAVVVAMYPRQNTLVVSFRTPSRKPKASEKAPLLGDEQREPKRSFDVSRVSALALLFTAGFPNLLLLLLTGSATSSTAQVKLLPGNPYFPLFDTALANARTLIGTILDGQVWSAEFLPKGGAPLACLGLAAIVWRGQSTKRFVRAALVLLLALSMFVPCLYVTFLWNRLRYLWPFATGWIIGLSCLACAIATLVSRLIDRRIGAVTGALVAGAFAGSFVVRLEWVLEDTAQSASGIDRQQATLGRWAKDHLPADARIGVNDTGAIAYFGDRKTFDVVGLTTPSEGRYWIHGGATRYEHYERMKATAPSTLPTHFFVYPEWMSCEAILGRTLTEATVTDATILGGQTMRASEARYEHLGSGELPWSTTFTTRHDAIDVADLESEIAHGYQLLGAHDGEQSVHEGNSPSGGVVLDGGRTNRLRDRFSARLPADVPITLIARLDVSAPTKVVIAIGNGKEIARVDADVGPWIEIRADIPADTRGHVDVDVHTVGGGNPDATFTSYHYWLGSP